MSKDSFSEVNSLLSNSGIQQAIRMATQIGSQNIGGMGNTGSAHRQSQQQLQQTHTGGSGGPNSVFQASALHFHTHIHIYASSGDDNDRSKFNQVECKHGNGIIDNSNANNGISNGGNVGGDNVNGSNVDDGMDNVVNNSDLEASSNERSLVVSNGGGMSSSSSSSSRQAQDARQMLPSDVGVDLSGMEHPSSATASSAGSSTQQAQQSRPMVPSSHSVLVPSRAPSLAPALSQIIIPSYMNSQVVNSTGTSSGSSSASSGGPPSVMGLYSAYGYQNASMETSATRDPGNGYGYNMNNGNTKTTYSNSTNYGGWTQAQGYGGYIPNALAAPVSTSFNNNANGSYNNYGNNYNKNNNAVAIRIQEQGFDANYRSNEMVGMIPSSSTYPSSTSVYPSEYIADPFQNSGSWQGQQTWGGMSGYQGVGLGAATGSGIGAGVGTSRGLGYSMNDQNNQNLPMLMREFEPTMDRGYNMGNGFNTTDTVDTTFRQTSVPQTLEYPPHLLNHLVLVHYFDNNNGLAELNANSLPNVGEAHYNGDEENESDFDDGEDVDDDEGVDDDVNIPEREPEFGQLGDHLHVQETGQNQLQSQYQYQGQWIGRSSIQPVAPTPMRSPLPTAFFKQENPNNRN